MADKYVDVSATYNGDGTTKDQASSDGGVGAWNSLIDVWNGGPTYGSIAAGDHVYIRANNQEESVGGSFTMNAVGSVDAPVVWELDDGSIWSGDTGTFTLFWTSNYDVTLASYNNLISPAIDKFILENRYNDYNRGTIQFYQGSYYKNIVYQDATSVTNNTVGGPVSLIGVSVNVSPNGVFYNCKFNMVRTGSTSIGIFDMASYPKFTFLNCTIDISRASTSGGLLSLIPYASGAFIDFIGGKIIGATSSWLTIVPQSMASDGDVRGCDFRFYNTDIGNLTPYHKSFTVARIFATTGFTHIFENCNEAFNFCETTLRGYIRWEKGLNFPTLNAILPDSTAWSIQCAPNSINCQATTPFKINKIQKLYVATAATKTIRAELAIKDCTAFASPTDEDFWLEIHFIDSNGNSVFKTSKGTGTALTTSSATWSPDPPVYGANNYDTYKIEIPSGVSIKQNTMVYATLFCAKPAINDNDYFFVCPDIQLD